MLHIRVAPVSGGEVVVVVRGELDCATSGQLRAAITALLNRGGIDAIGLDLRGLDLLDSIGIGTIVVAQRICRQVGVRLPRGLAFDLWKMDVTLHEPPRGWLGWLVPAGWCQAGIRVVAQNDVAKQPATFGAQLP